MSLNRTTLIGHLGQDPQLRYTPQGNPVCTLSIATDESYTDKATGERKEAVEWHRVIVWGKQGTNCPKCSSKGVRYMSRASSEPGLMSRTGSSAMSLK